MCLPLLVLVTLALIWTSVVPGALPLIVPRDELLFHNADIQSIHNLQNQYRSSKPGTPKALPVTLAGSERIAHYPVQQWKGIPEFLATAISTSSERPITVPYTRDQQQVTVVVTAYTPSEKGYPTKSEEKLINFWFNKGAPGIDTYPILHVAPFDAKGWDAGTAVWVHILHSLNQLNPDGAPTQHSLEYKHSDLILSIAWANPEYSQMLYYKQDKQFNPSHGYRLWRVAMENALTQEERKEWVQVKPHGHGF